jgi:hypothetical protein
VPILVVGVELILTNACNNLMINSQESLRNNEEILPSKAHNEEVLPSKAHNEEVI